MHKTISIALLSVLVLAGCAAAPVAEPTATPDPAPTPSIDLGPVALVDEEAQTYYLQMVCQGNVATNQFWDAIEAGEPEFLNGGDPDPTAAKAAAFEQLRLNRLFIEILDDTYFTWPEVVEAQLVHLRSVWMANASTIGEMANASRFFDIYYAQYPEMTAEQISAAQEIRYQLNLDADAVSSCVGHETGLDEIHAEMVERNEVIAKFEDELLEWENGQ
jgi:hypothetical protein